MRSEEYRRLHEVCREMALQSHSENLQDRWLKNGRSLVRSRE